LSIFAPLPPRSIYSTRLRIVGVIFSPRDLLRANELSPAPDFFELRLDALEPFLDQVESVIRSLRVPLIITARHPREGGLNHLTPAGRAALLQRFLDQATYIDIELRALRELHAIHRNTRRRKIGLIISFHDLNSTPTVAQLCARARAAAAAGADVFKVATRTDTRRQLDRLLRFFDKTHVDLPISAMGIGKLGRVARLELARRGSVLVYGSIGRSRIEGQISIEQLRSALSAFNNRAPS
jgi:3-dehydroquinate dehydratase I